MIIFLLLLGLLLLIVGATGIVNSSLGVASKIRISPLIIGITVVALGTSLPEITIAIFGGIDRATHLALGNIIGSNIANIGLILGFLILLGGIKIGRYKTQKNSLINLFLSIIMFIVLVVNKLSLTVGAIFLTLGFAILWFQIRQGINGALIEDRYLLNKIKSSGKNVFILGFLFIVSLIALAVGGKLTVDYGIALARLFEIPQTVIGITAIALGTSLPELTVSIIGLIKNQEKLVVGNILGSNIFNTLIGGGILGIYKVGGLENYLTLMSFLTFSVLLSIILYFFKGKEIPRLIGFVFLLFYGLYLYFILI